MRCDWIVLFVSVFVCECDDCFEALIAVIRGR